MVRSCPEAWECFGALERMSMLDVTRRRYAQGGAASARRPATAAAAGRARRVRGHPSEAARF